MAFTEAEVCRTVVAAENLTQFRGVQFDGTQVDTKGQQGYGVVANTPDSGEAATVVVGGTTKCEAGAAVTVNTAVVFDASGRVIESDAVSQYYAGVAREAATAAGEIIAVEITTLSLAQS